MNKEIPINSNSLIACICEGGFENFIINHLIEHNLCCFSYEQLIEENLIRRCSAREFERRYLNHDYGKKLIILRIIDSKQEQFNLKKIYKNKVEIINVVTAPEIEILVIIAEGRYRDYSKVSNSQKPSEYCKMKLSMPHIKKVEYLKEYFSDSNKLINAIKKYKKIHKSDKNTFVLADLLSD